MCGGGKGRKTLWMVGTPQQGSCRMCTAKYSVTEHGLQVYKFVSTVTVTFCWQKLPCYVDAASTVKMTHIWVGYR